MFSRKKDQGSVEQLRKQLRKESGKLTKEVLWLHEPARQQRAKNQVKEIEYIVDHIIDRSVAVFPEVVLEADELGELVQELASAIQQDSGGASVDAAIKNVSDYLLETTQRVHPEVLEDVSGSYGEKLLCKWSLRGFADMRSQALRSGDVNLLTMVEKSVQELRDSEWGVAFPDLFEKYEQGF